MLSRDDIIEAASKAGFETKRDMIWVDQWEITPALTRFVALVAAAEREACAKLAASKASVGDASNYPTYIAAAIRARGNK
jgi:hypothetical protein